MKRIMSITEKLIGELREAARVAGRVPPKPPNCLIVEDEVGDAELSKRALETVGVQVQVAVTGEEAITKLEQSKDPAKPDYDIVFLDLLLKGSIKQGLDVLEYIRSHFPSVHTVLVSAHIDAGTLAYVAKERLSCSAGRGGCGYIGIISKPLHKADVREVLEKHRMAVA